MTRHTTACSLSALLLLSACSGGGGGSPTGPVGPADFTVSDLIAIPSQDGALLSWSTSHAATALIEWGQPGNLLNSLSVLSSSKQQSVPLAGLAADCDYAFRVIAIRDGGQTTYSDEVAFHTTPTVAFAADDFNANNLDRSRWSLVDPTGAGELRLVGAGSLDARLELEVPEKIESLPTAAANGAVRVVQPAPSGDFDLEVKFEGGISTSGTGHGLTFEVDQDTYLRFDFAYNTGKLQVYAAILDGGATVDSYLAKIQSGTWADGAPMWMRVARAGQSWSQQWSLDGTNWTSAAAFTFAQDPTLVGLHAVAVGDTHPGHQVKVDYLLESGLGSDDDLAEPDVLSPLVYRAEAVTQGDEQIALSWWSDEPADAILYYGRDAFCSDGTIELSAVLYAQDLLLEGLDPDTTYHFQIVSRDTLGRETYTGGLTASTNPPGISGQPAFALWYGAAQQDGSWVTRFGHLGNAQHQVNVLGQVSDDDEAHLAATVTLSYKLNGGAWQGLAMGDDRANTYEPWRLANEGDFNLELELWQLDQVALVNGVYRNEVLFEALDDDGHATYQTVYVDYTPGVTWDMAAGVDWSQVSDLQDAVQIIDGDWYVDDSTGFGPGLRVRPGTLGYDRLVALGEGEGADAWENYEVTVTGTVLGLDPEGYTDGTQSYAMGLALRWSGHNPGWGFDQPNHDIYPFGGIFIYRWFETFERWELWINKDETIIPFDAPVAMNTTYVFKSRCETQVGGGTRYRIKRWVQGQGEPAAWDFDYTTPADQDHPEGSLLLISHHVDVLFGNVTITQL